jgi:hypothetical protein
MLICNFSLMLQATVCHGLLMVIWHFVWNAFAREILSQSVANGMGVA